LNHQFTVVRKTELYTYFSMVLTFPVIVWPVLYMQFVASYFEGYFQWGWIFVAGMVLMVSILADSILSGLTTLRMVAVLLAWILLLGLFIMMAFNFWNGVYLVAVMFFLHSFRSCLDLWQGRGAWWSWSAWVRDILTSFSLFLWQPFLV